MQEIDQSDRLEAPRVDVSFSAKLDRWLVSLSSGAVLLPKVQTLATLLPLFGAMAREDVGHPVVPFVTGNFVQRTSSPIH